jgi:hypothetical protein
MYENPFNDNDAYKMHIEHYENDWKKTWRRRARREKRPQSIASILLSALTLFVR